jgi:hypothetical protein
VANYTAERLPAWLVYYILQDIFHLIGALQLVIHNAIVTEWLKATRIPARKSVRQVTVFYRILIIGQTLDDEF